MTTQEIIDLAAQFDLITFGPQDIVYFAREIEKRTIERCAKVCDDIADESKKLSDEYDRQEDCSYLNQQFGAEECAAAIRALGDDDE